MDEEIKKSYEQAIDLRKHTENRRDEINKYYTSLFSAMVSIMPFIGKVQDVINIPFFSNYSVNVLVFMLSIIGIILNISWIKILIHIHLYIIALEDFLRKIEGEKEEKLFTYLAKFLYRSEAPSKVTKHEMWVPYSFMLIFIVSLILSISSMTPGISKPVSDENLSSNYNQQTQAPLHL